MSLWVWISAGIVTAAAVGSMAWLHVRFWTRRLRVEMAYDDEERLPTDDGSAIELRRVGPANGLEPTELLPPVMLVHGLASDHRNLDAWPEQSLARALAAAGRDVWLLTLRSGLPDWHHRPRAKVDLDAMAAHDLEAGARAIRARTGIRRLDYVGFSMGGMLLYAAMGNPEYRAGMRRVVTIGSPGTLLPRLPLWRVVRRLPLSLVPRLPLQLASRAIAFAVDWLHTPLHGLACNPRNFLPGAMGRALVNCIRDVPRSLMRELAQSSFGNGDLVFRGRRVLDSLADVETPALFVAGNVDRIAPAECVRMAFDAWGRRRPEVVKELVLLGRAQGQNEDYGHGDLAVGARVAEELFPIVTTFLDGLSVSAPRRDSPPVGVADDAAS